MFRRWGVGSNRGGQSFGSTQTTAYPDSEAHSEPDGYTNGNGYVYADTNSATRALCQSGHFRNYYEFHSELGRCEQRDRLLSRCFP